MCGFAGVLRSDHPTAERLVADARAMAATLSHRGPDDEGVWHDVVHGVAFGFRRLAIVDLSELGHQPMRSASGRFCMVFNGEVYNHVELRRQLERAGHRFRGGSDTEVVLAAFECWGVRAAVRRFVGMFAIVVWDGHERELHLVRDRLGIKPLFVAWRPGVLLFGSELKALMALRDFDRTLDRDALTSYFRYLYVPAPRTIFRSTQKLLPGHQLTVRSVDAPPAPSLPYWSLEQIAREGASRRRPQSDREVLAEAEHLLSDAVALRMRADVPVGAFLSGGIDSSTVAALMQACSPRPVRTFTIAFAESEFDEAEPATRIAEHLGTDHTQLLLTEQDALAMVPRLPEIFDEPLADPSQIPTWLVSRMAREQVTVALSGDGGDELFGGYNRYTHGNRLLSGMLRVPPLARRLAGAAITGVSTRGWDQAYRSLAPVLPQAFRHRLPGEKLHKVGRLLAQRAGPEMYRSLLSAWQEPTQIVRDAHEVPGRCEHVLGGSEGYPLLDRMMLADQLTYLPDDLLAKVDRASMALGLEVRVPILDHRVVEFSWQLAPHHRVRDGKGKWVLRELLRRHVPEELFERPKMGFSVPIAAWMRGALRPWVADLLSPASIERGGILHSAPIQQAWQQLQAGHLSHGPAVWSVLMFQAWHDRWME